MLRWSREPFGMMLLCVASSRGDSQQMHCCTQPPLAGGLSHPSPMDLSFATGFVAFSIPVGSETLSAIAMHPLISLDFKFLQSVDLGLDLDETISNKRKFGFGIDPFA